MLRPLLLSIITLFICANSFAQMNQNVRFKNYQTNDFGSESLKSLSWDQNGSFWAISEEGLINHNGYYKHIYSVDPNGGEHLISEQVQGARFIDSENLWISYQDTAVLTHVNTKELDFHHYFVPELMKDSLLTALVVQVKKAPDDQLWLCTWGAGLIRFTPGQVNDQYILADTSLKSDAGLFIKDLSFTSDDSIFVTFFNGRTREQSKPCFFNPDTEEYRSIDLESAITGYSDKEKYNLRIASAIIHFVYEDDSGNFWLGSYSGLLHYDREKNRMSRVSEKGEDPLLLNQVNTLNYIAKDGELWIATFNKGIMRVDIESRDVQFYYNDPTNSESLQSNRISGISLDPIGNVWVLNGKTGISVYNPFIHNFKLMYWKDMELEYSNRSNQNIPVNQLYVHNSKRVFVSSKIGLNVYDSQKMSLVASYSFKQITKDHGRIRGVQHFKVLGDTIFLNHDTYPHFFVQSSERLIRHEKEYGAGMIAFRHDPSVDKLIYIRSGKNGSRLLDFSEGFDKQPFTFDLPNGVRISETFSFETTNGNWIFSEDGGRFVMINPADSSWKMYSPSRTETYFPDSTVKSCLIQDSEIILIGTSQALYEFNELTGESTDISKKIGLKEGEGVNSMVIDDNGVIWLALKSEIYSWNPQTEESIRYTDVLGVESSDFLPAIGQKDELGNLYFASMYGVFYFHPDEVKLPEDELIVSLHDVKVNEQSLEGTELDDFTSGQTSLHWNDNYLEFYFFTNQVFGVAPHSYSYKLEGLNDKWISCGTSNHIRFDNLQYGDYVLKFKGTNAFGVESEVYEIPFTIRKPYWKTWWFILICVFASALLVFVVVRQRMRALKKRSEILEETVKERTAEVVEQKQEADRQREMVEEKQQEITDSITYAKRIQDAILPSEELINLHLPQSFIMYRPKDIVAGDFYWMEPLNEGQFIVAAADCTGHGVPGAMVSVVCNNALNRSVREFKISDTGKLLDSTKELVVEQFEKNAANVSTERDETIKDGMDISICKVDTKNRIIFWSGANNPLWIIRNEELIEIKGNKQPVGKFDPSTNFTTHEVKVESDDIFYIFSDGYADQFGGEKGKKFKSSSLKKLLLSIHKLSLSEQLKRLEKQFDDWKGDYEQLDDVCVIGFKID